MMGRFAFPYNAPMPKPRVIITETLDDTPAGWLAEQADVVWCAHDDAGLSGHLATAEGLVVRTYTQVNDAMLDAAPKLRVVGRAGVGLDNIDVPACRRRGVEVVYTPDANTQAVVEYLFALILDAHRPRASLTEPIDAATFHRLRKEQVGLQIERLSLGILGFGRIGKRVGQVAHAIGMSVLVNDILPEASLRKQVEYPYDFVDKKELFSRSDVLTIHVDGRATNHHLVDDFLLSQMKPDALLINAARGPLIDNKALAAGAKQVAPTGGRAVLDVHDPEPIPADYPFWGMPNVRLLPHLASRTNEALENMSWVVKDVMAVLEGGKPHYPAP
jgi:phosphoglycerate dehydrogenase-like enzyme